MNLWFILLLGGALFALAMTLWLRASERRALREEVRRERHDWNNHVMSLMLNTTSLRHRLMALVSSDTHNALDDIVGDIEAQGHLLMRKRGRLDKLLALHVDELSCNSACPGCRQVGQQESQVIVNLTVNAREARARAGGGQIVARCDHKKLEIENPIPEKAPSPSNRYRTTIGLQQIDAGARSLGWNIENGPQAQEGVWRSVILMGPEEAPLSPSSKTGSS
ncbi:MAG: hypothetical protein AAGD10_19230 [Myxococcota bacterium]